MSTVVCGGPLPTSSQHQESGAVSLPAAEKSSYREILKSSALVGGSSLITIVIGMVRTKAMAVLLGPAGFALTGLYSSIADIAQVLAGMGLNSSGVRQIAEASGTGDVDRIARKAAVLRRTALVLGVVGAVLLTLLSPYVSRLTFGNAAHTGAISLLALAVLFRSVSAGQTALLQGMRRIADLARVNVWSSLFGMISGLVLVYFLRERGVALALVSVAAMSIATSNWYSRKVPIPRVSVTPGDVKSEVGGLLKLGFAFMFAGLLTMGTAYIVRILLVREVGLEATGSYQAAWTLGGLYVGFILQAMGADFYPRLTALVHDHPACNRIVNEQTRVGLLLGGPGVLATLTFTPLVVEMFYSAKFHAAVDILRWISLGSLLQVVSWPIGFISLAKARQNVFLISDLAWAAFYTGLAWALIRRFGANGAGMAFFGSYVFHLVVTYPIARKLSGFRWSRENFRLGAVFFGLAAITLLAFRFLPLHSAEVLGTLLFLATAVYALRSISTYLEDHRFLRLLKVLRPKQQT